MWSTLLPAWNLHAVRWRLVVCSKTSLFVSHEPICFSQLLGEINAHLLVDDMMFTCAGKMGHEVEKIIPN